ncbi:MAG TPA: hypothetical protein VFG63_02490 [Nocardioidaceae bacterium]|nr:hypothetical protein [Nocardioidaceae bacterium]
MYDLTAGPSEQVSNPVGSPTGRPDPIPVLYILGASRTGSTIIANILGQLEGCFAVGELWNLWRRGLLERRLCGCGVPVPDCPVWREVLHLTFSGEVPGEDEARRLDVLARGKLRGRDLGAALRRFGRPPEDDRDDYRWVLSRLYRAVSEVTGCRVIVDSSKGPIYGLFLAGLPDLQVTMVNVIRDSRAVAFSAQRRVRLHDFGDERLMQQVPPWVGARRWLKWQLITDSVVRSRQPDLHCVKYEDFSREPRAVIAELARLVGDSTPLPFLAEHSARLGPTHSVSGNPSRFKTGAVPIRVDDEWRTAMGARDKAVVTALTLPLLLYHGYPVLPRQDGDRVGHGG